MHNPSLHPPQRLPSGTVIFLFTDIEGSTRLWQEQPSAMTIAHMRHDEILREAIESNQGFILQVVGDSFSAAFANAPIRPRAALPRPQPVPGSALAANCGHPG
jgi:class 3 adenylate cyclase